MSFVKSLNEMEVGVQQVKYLLEEVLRKQDENFSSLSEQTVMIQEAMKNLLVASSANIPTVSYTQGDHGQTPKVNTQLRLRREQSQS